MELEFPSRTKFLNPELEIIRNTVIRESAIKNHEWIEELIRKTSIIHAGFLFEDEKTLQNLCLFVGETQNKLTDCGWVALGHHLGLNPSALKVINNNNFNKEDPTYNTLLAFVQQEDATIGKIIIALKDIGRLDVISRMRNPINDLADIVLQQGCNINFDNSDYGSLQSEVRNTSCSSECNLEVVDIYNNSSSGSGSLYDPNHQVSRPYRILKPNVIPPAPFIFQNIRADRDVILQRIQQSFNRTESSLNIITNHSNDIIHAKDTCAPQTTNGDSTILQGFESFQYSALPNVKLLNNPPNTGKTYGKIVLLTFACDGEKYATELCKILRKTRDDLPKLGVLVLSEHANEVLKDPVNFITSSICQVDYICPILTESYFNIIMRKEKSTDVSDSHLDAKYVQFIYSQMSKYYINNGCINDKIRCVIPDKLISKIHFNLISSLPIFAAWMLLSEAEQLAIRLLKSKT